MIRAHRVVEYPVRAGEAARQPGDVAYACRLAVIIEHVRMICLIGRKAYRGHA